MVYAYKATAGVWCTLSFFIVVGSIVAFFMPFWLVKTNDNPFTIDKDNNFADIERALTIDNHAACGIMSYCIPYNNLPHANKSVVLNFEKEAHLVRCPIYSDFSAIPTVFGKVSSVLFGAGTVILLVSWVFSAISLCYGYMCDVSTYLLISIVQLFCLIINGVAILLWVLSWDKDEFKCGGEGYCGDALEPFKLGDCELGWAFLLGLASTGSIVLAIFFGCLSLFLQKQKDS